MVEAEANALKEQAADPIFDSVVSLADGIRRRTVSAAEVVDAHLSYIGRRNEPINAVVTIDGDRARARAREADAALARGELWGPLHGVPFTVKDWIATKDVRTTLGQTELAEFVPNADAEPVARWKEAGGILLGKTNTPGLGGGYQSFNPVFGCSNNPWNLARTPGGSSGGSAAAVAAGFSPLDLGSDGGGSLRVPAHYCGVYTIKATERRVPRGGPVFPTKPAIPSVLRYMATAGPITRSVDDLALALSLICGPGPDTLDVPPVPLDVLPVVTLSKLRLAWSDDFGAPVTADTRHALAKLAGDLEPLVGRIESRLPDDFDGALASETWGALWLAESGVQLPPPQTAEPLPDVYRETDDHSLRGMAHIMEGTITVLVEYMLVRDRFIASMEHFFTEWDALLCPVSVSPAIPHAKTGTPTQVDDQRVPHWAGGVHYTAPFNLTGHPAVVIPLARSREGLPIGLQIVGRRWDDMRILAIARTLSEVVGTFQRPPGY
jgi:amidase